MYGINKEYLLHSKERIDKKYKDYVNAYMNGTRNANTQRYINTRLTAYFSGYLIEIYEEKHKNRKDKQKVVKKPPLNEEQIKLAKEEFDKNRDFIERYLKKLFNRRESK